MHQDIATILVTTEQINDAVARLGQELTSEYRDKNPLVIGVLPRCGTVHDRSGTRHGLLYGNRFH